MHQILLVEDSNMFGRLAKKRIEQEFDVPVFWAKDYAQTVSLLQQAKNNFSMAILDYNLPDAPNGEVIDLVTGAGISSFVFTADMTEEVRSYVWSKRVADYILKDDPNSLDYIISGMRQLGQNHEFLILVVDDDSLVRTMISELLYVRQYRVINAADGQTALKVIEQYPEVKLIITDFTMPNMDGCQFCQRVRERFKTDMLAIIGMHGDDDRGIAARFIKSGANDFIVKNELLVEEFYCRVNHCLETVSLFARIKENGIRDFLTGLHNRRYFFDEGESLIQALREKGESISCVMLDIDHFKSINDTHGHDAGDVVLINTAELLRQQAAEEELVCRLGGEEFALIVPFLSQPEVIEKVERLRQTMESCPVVLPGSDESIMVTASFGICADFFEDLEEMLKLADQNLFLAKEGGRNRICY